MRATRYILKRLGQKIKPRFFKNPPSPNVEHVGAIKSFILETIANNDVFLHAGLSKIRNGLMVENPFEFLISLSERTNSFMTPGFTPSFRKSGIYHKKFSIPEYGAFSRLMLNTSNSRTNDCIHSIFTIGRMDFEGCDFHNTFSDNGCYALLSSENVLIANIGTNELVSTQFHFIEKTFNCPYVGEKNYRGVIYEDEEVFHHVEQKSYFYKEKYVMWNRAKIKKVLLRSGILKEFSANGLNCSFFRAGEATDCLGFYIKKDPYFLLI